MVLQPISLPPTAVTGANAAQLRTNRLEPVEASTQVQTDLSAVLTSQSVVIHFGAQALNLARSTATANRDATAPEGVDADDTNATLNPLADDTDSLLANAFGPNQTNAALLGALDASARQALLTPGAVDLQSGLFAEQPPNALESGFFRLPAPPTAESLLFGQVPDDALEPGLFGAPANDTLESTFPFSPAESTPSGFFASPNAAAGESGFFASANAAAERAFPAPNTLVSEFPPAAPTTTTDSLFPQSLIPDGLAPTFPPESSLAPEATFPRALAANDAETGLFRAPGNDGTGTELDTEQQREVDTLEQTERQLRADEQAQRAAAGGYADGTQLRYEIGPDGRRYVVSADVPLDVTPIPGDPAATLRKMEVIMRAANAGTPSVSDQNASSRAAQLARQARAQLAASRYAEAQEY
ncbi:MAG TPA: putative metalloprotease CJM1_0395 family protein [Polyangiaceae bacterium]|nr:putative metalloprotease CJM1_0395 family protein [Polyangiaceae bacterium]